MKSGLIELEVVLSINEPLPAVDAWLVIDLLRASTTIVSWFEKGGKEIYPEASVDSALELKRRMVTNPPLLMGERNAVPPEGFDKGNSPLEITEEITKKYPTAIMATSNGTKGLLKAIATGAAVYVACARNSFYAVDIALTHGSHIGILCAGRLGRPALDDTICAGMMAERICRAAPNAVMSDGANMARMIWKSYSNLESGVRSSDHAKFLEKIGFSDDIKFCCRQDTTACVPELKEVADEFGYGGLRAVLKNERTGGLRYFSPDIVSSIMNEEAERTETPAKIDEEPEKNTAPVMEEDIFLGETRGKPRKTIEIDFGE